MRFNDYKIPNNITEEDEFMYNLMDKIHWTGSGYGFVMGTFTGLLKNMEEKNISQEIQEEALEVYKNVDGLLRTYDTDIREFVYERWDKLGQPLSLKAHQAKKAKLDAEDDFRSEYYDR